MEDEVRGGRGRGGQGREPFVWPEDVERIIERAMRGLGPWPLPRVLRQRLWESRYGHWVPDVDVFRRQGKLVVRVDLPGVRREDIDVSVEDDALVISGRREEDREAKEEDYYRFERPMGRFHRTISIPRGVRPEEIEARYREGVLEVEERVPPEQARKTRVGLK